MIPIEKGNIKVRVTTTNNTICGTLYKATTSRTLDLLNSKERFIALTDAIVYGEQRSEELKQNFIAINIQSIVSVEEL